MNLISILGDIQKELGEMKYTARDGRFFALIIGLALLFIGWRFGWLGTGYLAVITLIFLAGLFMPLQLFPVYKTWMIFGLTLGWVMSRLLLTIVFILIISPLAIIRRMRGDYAVEMGPNDKKSSYWHETRQKTGKKQYLKQF